MREISGNEFEAASLLNESLNRTSSPVQDVKYLSCPDAPHRATRLPSRLRRLHHCDIHAEMVMDWQKNRILKQQFAHQGDTNLEIPSYTMPKEPRPRISPFCQYAMLRLNLPLGEILLTDSGKIALPPMQSFACVSCFGEPNYKQTMHKETCS